MIEGVLIKELAISADKRGYSVEIMTRDEDIFVGFGDIHLTAAYPGVVRAWHKHEQKSENVLCVQGMAKLVLFDSREGSSSRGELMQVFLGEDKLLVVRIPPGVYHGYKCVSDREAVLFVISDKPYDRDNPDVKRLPPDTVEIPYDWKIKMG